MACFLVPAAEAIVTSAIQKVAGKEKTKRYKLGWLNAMLWGGVFLLAVEHIWHGEVVPWPPFLTAMTNPQDTAIMLHEMATNGLAMAITITVIWAIIVAITISMENKLGKAKTVKG